MNFSELPIGAKFRFYRRGKVLEKTSKDAYTGLTGLKQKVAPDAEVLAEDEDIATPPPREAPKVDDVGLISKALDALEAHGKSPEVAAARQALRRLDALARMRARSSG